MQRRVAPRARRPLRHRGERPAAASAPAGRRANVVAPARALGSTSYDVVEQGSSPPLRRDGGRRSPRSVPFRYVWPAELDLMARIAGMRLRDRWGDWRGARSRRRAGATFPSGRSRPDARQEPRGDPRAARRRGQRRRPRRVRRAARARCDGDRASRRSPRQRHSRDPGCRAASVRPRPHRRDRLVDKLQSGDLALTFARVEVFGAVTRGTVVSRRQADGSWRILLDHPMSP